MSQGHRSGHRHRGRGETSPPPSRERTLVLPGEELPGQGLKPGAGTYRVGGKVYASVLGLLAPKPPFLTVIPLSGRYIPKAGDTVIGVVTDCQTTFWLLDIAAPRWAPLHVTGSPWKVEVGETDQYLRVGDAVVVRVESLEATGRIGVTMLGDGLGKLEGGTIVSVSPARIPRVVGRNGSMVGSITAHTGAEIAVGQNGRIWVGGSPEAIHRTREALRMIDEQGQHRGLTARVESYLTSTDRAGDRGPERAPIESAHRDAIPHELPPLPDVSPDEADGAGPDDSADY
jgi:exosome complex component RRP4